MTASSSRRSTLRACSSPRAPFVARTVTGDRELPEILERAIAHPGFAIVEILELCTAYATRWNPLTGAKLREVAEEAGYELGVLRDEPRPGFAEAYRRARPAARPDTAGPEACFEHDLTRPVGLVLAGTAGERIQTAATILAKAAIACGLHVTQKNDNPVTQGTGFSVSEVIIGPEPILHTGIERPDAVLVTSADGLAELGRTGVLASVGPKTQVIADESLDLPPLAAEPLLLPLRAAGAKRAALAAVAAWAERQDGLPLEALRAAAAARLGENAEELALLG